MMSLRALSFALSMLFASLSSAYAQKQERAEAAGFTIQLFMERTGELSPDVFKIEEFVAFNFGFHGKNLEGGKFSGFLTRVELRAPREVFAEGKQAELIFRDRKSKKVLRTWNISDVYIGDNGVSFRGQFFTGLDCTPMEVTLVAGKRRITRELAFQCGE
jgi:hypothetical protein